MIRILAIFLLLSASSCYSQTVIKIVDGDTFKAVWNGDTVAVRLCGVDTPESRKNSKAKKDAKRSGQDLVVITTMGKSSTEYLNDIMPVGTKVTFEFDVTKKDRYGRLLAYVYLSNGTMVNEQLVVAGMANTMTIPPNVKYAERFRKAEASAREKRLGHWQ